MKGPKGFGTRASMDLGTVFDEIFEAARNFQDEFCRNFDDRENGYDSRQQEAHPWMFDESTDYYPNYSYPPMNVYMTGDRSLIFEFALAGFDEKDINLSFQGDYMVFSAAMPRSAGAAESGDEADSSVPGETIRYFKHRLKMKAIEKQKYYVPLDKYAQDKVKAIFRNGILKVSVPPKEEQEQSDGIRITIITEDS